MIYEADAILTSCEWKDREKVLKMELKAFPGHEGKIRIFSPVKAKVAVANDRVVKFTQEEKDEGYWIEAEVEHRNAVEKMWVSF